MDELIYQSAKSIARSIQNKEVSAVEVVEAHLKRIEEVNQSLNAVVQLCGDRALDEAREADAALASGETRGALHGVPIGSQGRPGGSGLVKSSPMVNVATIATSRTPRQPQINVARSPWPRVHSESVSLV